MLLDAVSMLTVLRSSFTHAQHDDVLAPLAHFLRVFVSSLSDALAGFSVSGYFALAKEFDISVNEVASSFSASTTGIAVFTYVIRPACP